MSEIPTASGGVLTVLRFMRDPRGTLLAEMNKHGDLLQVRDNRGVTVMTGHPEAIKAVFTADPDTFGVPMKAELSPLLGDSSLLFTEGERHRKDRKLLSPPFHGARMRAYGKHIVESARTTSAGWKVGQPFVMQEATQAMTLEVILRAVFGIAHGERKELFRGAVVELITAMASPFITLFQFARRRFLGLGPWARFLKARERFDALVKEEIDLRRASPSAEREDILSLMMAARYDDGTAMTDQELRDQLHVLLFAGHDTTSTALTWAFYWLRRQPEVAARVEAELAGLGPHPEPEAIAHLPYLDAVCQETLRIHPVVINVGRLLKEPLEVMGYTLTPGTLVMCSVLLAHNREDLYPEPRRFRPERFLERKFTPFEFIPFGGGARRCIGAALALYEMKIVLGTLLPTHRLRLVKDAEVEATVRGLTQQPKGGVPMVLQP